MSALRIVLPVCAVLTGFASPVGAADISACLPKAQRQAEQKAGKIVPLAQAKRAVSAHSGEVVRARLCQEPNGLVYLLTLLARDGKVSHVAVDASSGRIAGGR